MEEVEVVSNGSSLGLTIYEATKESPHRAVLTLARGWEHIIFFHAVAQFPDLEFAATACVDILETWRLTGGVGVIAECYAQSDLWRQV